jgi:protein-disulfide isomerase
VQLVEFGDYECPFCRQAQASLQALEQALGAELCLAFRNFPIVGAHPHALDAAEAAEAAGAQGRFWQMHDLLYRRQAALELPDLEGYAVEIGVDVAEFVRDVTMRRHQPKIRADLHSGAVSGVNGTPTFFINGVRHDGGYDFESLMAAITGSVGAPAISH